MAGSAYRKTAVVTAAVLVAAIVFAAVVLLVRDDDNAPIQVVIPASDEGRSGSSGSKIVEDAVAGPSDAQLKVYVSGAVRQPGVYQMDNGDRLVDAVESAGGANEDAQLDLVNLSLRVVDQGHYHIPSPGEPQRGDAAAPGPAPQGTASDGLLDLNLASPELLETLPGIGPALAQAIVDYREDHGAFKSVDEITNVPRIGPITYQKIRELVTVDSRQ